MAENKVKFGIKNVYVAVITEENGAITYGTPFAMPGAVSLNCDPEGDMTPFYADNIKYYIANSNQGYSGDLELAMLPETFFTAILGQTKDTNGALIENAEDKTARFALMFEVDGDAKNRRTVYYDCTAARPSSAANTIEDSKEPQTDTISITMSARSTDKAVKAVIEPNTENEAVYNTFFTKVYEKDATASV